MTSFGLSRIRQIAVNVQDVEQATAFYRDTLGLPHLFNVPGIAFFDCDGVRLMLGRAETPEFDHPASVLYFAVDDIEQAYRTLTERGVKFEDAPHCVARMETFEVWLALFRDSEGNLLSLMSEPPV
jgi:predicted enzyme related to lactoylglutathione lyase